MAKKKNQNWLKQQDNFQIIISTVFIISIILSLSATFGIIPLGKAGEILCKGEGESIPVIAEPPECCEGLELIPPISSDTLGIHGICTANCGDGICDNSVESNYNCPEDCGSITCTTHEDCDSGESCLYADTYSACLPTSCYDLFYLWQSAFNSALEDPNYDIRVETNDNEFINMADYNNLRIMSTGFTDEYFCTDRLAYTGFGPECQSLYDIWRGALLSVPGDAAYDIRVEMDDNDIINMLDYGMLREYSSAFTDEARCSLKLCEEDWECTWNFYGAACIDTESSICGNGICEPGEEQITDFDPETGIGTIGPASCQKDCPDSTINVLCATVQDPGEKTCLESGESVGLYAGITECCGDLEKIPRMNAIQYCGAGDICVPIGSCGDGICDNSVETNYNCPDDCCAETSGELFHISLASECTDLNSCETELNKPLFNICGNDICEDGEDTTCISDCCEEDWECSFGDCEYRCVDEENTICGNGICEPGEEQITDFNPETGIGTIGPASCQKDCPDSTINVLCATVQDPGEKTCLESGESVGLYAGITECCDGLEKMPRMNAIQYCGAGDICVPIGSCGDGICDNSVETNYNCPDDCCAETSGELIKASLASGCVDLNECGTEENKPVVEYCCIPAGQTKLSLSDMTPCCQDLIFIDETDCEGDVCIASVQSSLCSDCGNGILEAWENSANCALDADICGNGVCESGESCSNCPADCGGCPTTSGGGGSSSRQQCRDRRDNDGDGLIDYPNDPGCLSSYDDDEADEVPETCTENWICGSWTECSPEGKQTRTCTDWNDCGTEELMPSIERDCEYLIEETCYDGIQNQDEEGIDCGGLCEPCIEIPIQPEEKPSYLILTIAIAIVILVLISMIIMHFRKLRER